MKKKLLLFLLLPFFDCCVYAQAEDSIQGLPRDLFRDIQIAFTANWQYFRMQRNPVLTYEETHDQWGQWKIPRMLPDTFWRKDYWPEVKISCWENTPVMWENRRYGNVFIRNPFLYIIEKGDGITGIKREWFTDKIIDTLQVNVYDSLFPYDNRFLVKDLAGVEWQNPNYRGPKFAFYSGNVDWAPIRDADIATAGYFRGVQFGIEGVKEYDKKMLDSLRRLRPEYPDYVYAIAEKAYFTDGYVLMAGHEKSLSDYIEYIFYTNDPKKTGDNNRKSYYEMRYLLPTNIQSITERRMVKRKLSQEELDRFTGTCLWLIFDRWFSAQETLTDD